MKVAEEELFQNPIEPQAHSLLNKLNGLLLIF